MKRAAFLLAFMTAASAVAEAQTTIYWSRDTVYGPGGAIATITPANSDTTAPTAPSSLAITGQTATYVDLSWTGSSDSGGSALAGYSIYRKRGASGASLPVGTVTSSTTVFRDSSLFPGADFRYSIIAFDNAQNRSSASNEVSLPASSDTTAPTTPGSLTLSYNSATSVHLSWGASTDSGGSGLAGYRIYKDGVLLTGLTPITSTSHDDTQAVKNTAITYTVKAVDNGGNESTGASRSVLRDDFNRPNGTDMRSAFWSADVWKISGNLAQLSAPTNDTVRKVTVSKSFEGFDATASMVQLAGTYGSHYGVLFWANDAGTEGYAVMEYFSINPKLRLIYFSPSSSLTVLSEVTFSGYPYTLGINADYSTRRIRVSVGSTEVIDFTETDTSRRRTGRVGLRAHSNSSVSGDWKIDDLIVVETND